MKKFLFVFLAAALVFSCQKKDEVNTPQTQDVVFAIDHVTPDNGGLKSTADDPLFPCIDEEPDYAWVVIDGVNYYPEVYRVDGKLYTQAIKLAPGSYPVTQFGLWYDSDNSGVPTGSDTPITVGDELVMATPDTGGTYEEYVTTPVPFDMTVTAFTKHEEPIEVLCFQPESYLDFGFNWFGITEIVIREACFFGDICISDPADFSCSIYDDDVNGVQADEEANFRVIVKRNGNEVPNSPFSNNAIYGGGSPLCVQYPDYKNQEDNYTFDIEVWVPSTTPGVFTWQYYGTLSTSDADPIPEAADGVVYFAVGDCSPDSNPVYDWLPTPDAPCDPAYLQDFESNSNGWYDYPGPITVGGGYATVENGAFTRFDQYLSIWPGQWSAEIDVYLDPSWANEEGFDYSVAAQGTDCAHQRDYVFHISKDISEDALLVGASNNSDDAPPSPQGLENGSHYVVTTAGWYTLQHVFRDDGGVLAVDLNLLDSGGTVLWTTTLSDASDLIPSVVGGNRYGWFTYCNVTGGIMVDNAKLTRPCAP